MRNPGNRTPGITSTTTGSVATATTQPVDDQDLDHGSPKHRSRRLRYLVPCALLVPAACTQAPQSSVDAAMLGTAASFLVLGASTVTSTGPTVIQGDLGLSPGSAVTGLLPGQVVGAIHVADPLAAGAQTDLHAAWTRLNDEPCDVTRDDAELGGAVLTPGVYCFTSPSAALTGQLTLDAQGQADAVFVFRIASTLTTASNSSVLVINGGSDCNVFWAVGSSATLGTATRFHGTILASASITATTGATVSGRLLAHTGAVTLDGNTVTLACNATTGPDGGTSPDGGTAPCGNGVLDVGERCDDANTVDGDGCSAACIIELPPLPTAVCGNGVLELGEQCDDANPDDFDGCSNRCTVTT